MWSRLGDLVRCILSFNFGVRSSISEVLNKLGMYNLAHLCLFKAKTQIINIVTLDFMTCSARVNIQSEGSISQLWSNLGR